MPLRGWTNWDCHPGAAILEIGCGAGFTTIALAQRGYSVRAVDTVPAMLDLTHQLATKAGVARQVTTTLGDVHRLPFSDNRFALVIAMGVLPWLQSVREPVHEMVRVIKPGGHLIVNTDNHSRLDHMLDPRLNPVHAPLRRALAHLLQQLSLRKPGACARTCSINNFDAVLSEAGLQKLGGMTLGFGPFSFFRKRLFSDALGVRIHHKLQSLADRNFPIIRAMGAQYIILGEKLSGLAAASLS